MVNINIRLRPGPESWRRNFTQFGRTVYSSGIFRDRRSVGCMGQYLYRFLFLCTVRFRQDFEGNCAAEESGIFVVVTAMIVCVVS